MYQLQYRITTVAPLVITSKQGDVNMVATEQSIPGSSVLGMLANRVITQKKLSGKNSKPHREKDFYEWFLAGRLNIGAAFIVARNVQGSEVSYFPPPCSLRKKKYENIIYDFLYKDEDPEIQTKAIKKFCVLEGDTLQTREVETTLNFHHARDREKGITDGEKIFTYEAIAPRQTFEGRITGEEQDLQDLLKICENKWDAYIGRSKNAQYGNVKFELLGNTLQSVPVPAVNDHEISLTLVSDTILYNENGFPTTNISEFEGYLKHLLGKGVTIQKANIKQGEVETFVSVWRLKKPSETCFRAGSTFLLDVSKCDSAKLAKLETHGIGERRHEGFGQCKVGWQKKYETLRISEEDEKSQMNIPKPEAPIPEQTKQILETLLREAIKKQMQLKAMEDQKRFRPPLPSKSLLSKLEALVMQKDHIEFVDTMYALRRTARNKLEQCRSPKMTLFRALTAQFEITDDTLAALEPQLPPDILAKLTDLKKKPELKQDLFKDVLREKLGEKAATQYQNTIVKYAFTPYMDVRAKVLLEQSQNQYLKAICEEITYKPNEDEELNDLYRLYWTTFFTMMRKRAGMK